MYVLPENFFQLFDFVVWVFLSAGVIQESSGISKRPGIYLKRERKTGLQASHDIIQLIEHEVMCLCVYLHTDAAL